MRWRECIVHYTAWHCVLVNNGWVWSGSRFGRSFLWGYQVTSVRLLRTIPSIPICSFSSFIYALCRIFLIARVSLFTLCLRLFGARINKLLYNKRINFIFQYHCNAIALLYCLVKLLLTLWYAKSSIWETAVCNCNFISKKKCSSAVSDLLLFFILVWSEKSTSCRNAALRDSIFRMEEEAGGGERKVETQEHV